MTDLENISSPNQKSKEPTNISDSYGQPRKNYATYRFKIGYEPEPEGPPEGEYWAGLFTKTIVFDLLSLIENK